MKSNSLKRVLTFLLAVCMGFSFVISTSAVEVESDASMNVSASIKDSTVTAVINISSDAVFRGVQVSLNYDDSKLTYVSASPSLISGITFYDTGSAVSIVGESMTDVASGTLATLTFAVKDGASGNILLSLDGIAVSDPTGTVRIPCSGGSTSVEIAEYVINYISASNGSVFGATSSPNKGMVSFTTSPSAGYEVDTITVTADSGVAVSVSGSSNTYTFTMPASNVNVNATFKAKSTTTTQSMNEINSDSSQGENNSTAESVPSDYDITLEQTESGTATTDLDSAAKDTTVNATTMPDTDAAADVTFGELPSEVAPQEEASNGNILLWILPAILVILIAALIVLLVIKKRRQYNYK